MKQKRRSRARTLLKRTVAATVMALGAIEVFGRLDVARQRRRRSSRLLFVDEKGNGGDPIVFLAGLQGSTRYWDGAFDSLAASRRCLYVDALGFGRSMWPPHPPRLEDHLAALRTTLVAHDATRRLTIVAHSFGTLLAAYYAANFNEDIERLILLGTPVFRGEADARLRIREISPIAAMFSLNRLIARKACLAMCALRPIVRRLLPRVSSLHQHAAEDAVLHDWPAIDGAIHNVLLKRPIENALLDVPYEVVFVHGREDGVTSLDRLQALASTMTAAYLLAVDGNHQDYVSRHHGLIAALAGG